jgi:hypothetical protein
MNNYVKSLLRMSIFFVLILAAVALAKPKSAQAFVDCCQNCADRYQACLGNCTTGTPLQMAACRSGCTRQEGFCIEVCPACL